MKEIYELVEVEDCPYCNGPSSLEEEAGGYYVLCNDCGAQTVTAYFKSDEERIDAAKTVAVLWATGKAIKSQWGE